MSVDLRTSYLGLELRSPLVAAPSPLTFELDTVARLEDAGVGAIVLPSLFEEEIVHEEIELNRSLEQGDEQFAEASSYFPSIESFAGAGDRYLARLEQIKARATVPVMASLNASTAGGWVRYGRLIQDAGADALELNIYHLAADGVRTAAEIEEIDLDLISAVRASITIPLVVKIGPFYSAVANFAGRAVERGADGLVIFNRFYEPDLDLEMLDVVNRLELSRPSELRLVLRWIAILRSRLGPDVGLAATSGIHTAGDAAKALLVGADVAMMTSALLVHGPEHVRTVEDGLRAWMAEREYDSVDQLRGSFSQAAVDDPAAYERANYLKTLRTYATPREFAAS